MLQSVVKKESLPWILLRVLLAVVVTPLARFPMGLGIAVGKHVEKWDGVLYGYLCYFADALRALTK